MSPADEAFSDAYFQPEAQSYPALNGASNFPQMHGQATSFFQVSDEEGVSPPFLVDVLRLDGNSLV